ncbi:MAG: cell envelope integrity protein TolA, partial [Glaciimonas sp.]|nr:cell envelope integrity protein TolA [Glaciimonas sp.]
EVWDMNAKEAAPPAPTPLPVEQPKPIVKPEPLPEPKPVIKEPPPPKVEQPVLPDPEIALAKERKRKEIEKETEQKKRDEEERKRLEKERQRKTLEDEQQAKKEQAKRDAAEEKADKKKTDAILAKQKAAEDAKQKQKLDAAKKVDAAASKARHDADMKRLLGQASGNGASNSTGTAEKSQGPRGGDPGYASRVGSKIRGNINFNVPDGLAGNPAAEFDVQLLPDGSIAGIRLRKSSGVSGFDEAVKRAIERSAPYPKDKSGSVPSSFTGIHKPKDQ